MEPIMAARGHVSSKNNTCSVYHNACKNQHHQAAPDDSVDLLTEISCGQIWNVSISAMRAVGRINLIFCNERLRAEYSQLEEEGVVHVTN